MREMGKFLFAFGASVKKEGYELISNAFEYKLILVLSKCVCWDVYIALK